MLPVDFEKKLRMPPGPDGKGYPAQISARDLMENFKYLDEKKGNGGTGSITFQDCDGNEVGSIQWVNGLITTDSNQIIETGCNSASSV